MNRAQFGCNLRSLAVECDSRTASGLAAHFDVAPCDSIIPPGADGLHRGFFGGETRGVALDAISFRFTVADLSLGKDPVQEAVAEARNRRSDARYFRYVDTGANDHAKSKFAKSTACQPSSYAPIVRPPTLDGFLDIGGGEIRGHGAFDQRGHFFVRGEAQRDELALAELRDLRAHGIGQQRGESQPLFKPYHPVLHLERVLPEPDDRNH